MEQQDYQKIMKYFPPVNTNIKDLYQEAAYSYNYYNSMSPLKPPQKNTLYSSQIISNLYMLRILLNSNITPDRFLYEINKLVQAWGPGGLYDKSLLDTNFINLISKINTKVQKQIQKEKELIDYAEKYNIESLTQNLSDVSFKYKYPKMNINQIENLDLSKLNIYQNKLTRPINEFPSKTIQKKKPSKRN
jgi:hypothetical protein